MVLKSFQLNPDDSTQPHLYGKMRKLCKKLMMKLPYSHLCEGVDEFTGDVIQTVHELQSIEVADVSTCLIL